METNTLQDSYTNGYKAFSECYQNDKGFWHFPANPHKYNSQYYKEWERGYSTAYFNNLKAVA